MTRRLRFRIIAGLAVTGAVAACAADPLNPQPLPPISNVDNEFADAGSVPYDAGFSTSADGGDVRGDAGGYPSNDSDASPAGESDAGDAGDAGDADADAGPT